MLGFSSATFIPRPRPPTDTGQAAAKPRQRKEANSLRFLVQRQGYLRNSRRILEIGAQVRVGVRRCVRGLGVPTDQRACSRRCWCWTWASSCARGSSWQT